MHKVYTFFCLLVLFGLTTMVNGQYVPVNNNNAANLAARIAGNGIVVSNAVLNCDARGVGEFTAIGTNLPIVDGIVLSTGNIQNPKVGGGLLGGEGTNFGRGGYPDLQPIANSNNLNDACILEFDLEATSDLLQFNFSFGSNEYLEFVGSNFNDAFGFFISGPGIVGEQNLAVLPGTGVPVTINTINNNANAAFYINSPNANPIPYDGFTRTLAATAEVQPCGIYHLVLVIVDAGDGIYDSSVFLEANSLTSIGASLDNPFVSGTLGNGRVYENCDSAIFTFQLDNPLPSDFTLPISIKGTATNGVDYREIPDSIVFLAGETTTEIVILPLTDDIADGGESVELCILDQCTLEELACQSITIEELLIDSIDDQFLCFGDTVQVETEFSPNYTYTWTPSNGLSCDDCHNPLVFPTDTTTYTYTVSDNGCALTGEFTAFVAAEKLPDLQDTIGCEGYITLEKDFSTVGFNSYSWEPATSGISSTSSSAPFFTVLDSAVTYTLTAENDYGCILTQDILIDVHPPVEATLEPVDILCKFDSTGSIFVNVTSPTPIDSFFWDVTPEFDGNPIQNIPAGDYAVRIVNLNGCTLDLDTTLLEPDEELIVLAEELKPSDCNQKNGLAVAEVSGGTEPYGVGTWTPEGGNDLQSDSLFAGDYVYTISDANGCIATDTATITNDNSKLKDPTMGQIGPFCLGELGKIIPVADEGGTFSGPGVDADGFFDPILAGQGTHTITYSFGLPCVASDQIQIGVNSSFEADIDPVNPICPLDGTVDLTSVTPGGLWFGPGLSSPDSTSSVFNPILAGPGTHRVYHEIVSTCGELDSLDIVVMPVDEGRIDAPAVLCPTGSSLQLQATPLGGVWSGIGVDASGLFDPTLPETGTGVYRVFYLPSGSCVVPDSVDITVVDTLEATAQTIVLACFGDQGSVSTTVSGGQIPYSYSWPSGVAGNSPTASGVVAGTYDVMVTDNTGCSVTVSHVVNEPSELVLAQAAAFSDVTCPNGSDGSLEVYPNGGTVAYTYSIMPVLGTNNGDGTFDDLPAGNYSVTVTDANGCSLNESVQINQPTPLVITGNPQTAFCGLPNGGVDAVLVSGANGPYSYLWSNGQTTADLVDVVPGVYVLTVTDDNGCTATQSFTVPNSGGASLSGNSDPALCFGESTGKAWVTATGGQTPYIYRWDTGETLDTIFNKAAGTYNVEVEDGTGCVTDIDITITEPSKVTIAPVSDSLLCFDQAYSIQLQGNNGNGAPYSYEANGNAVMGDTYVDSLDRDVTVIAFDVNGCASDPEMFSIRYRNPLSLQMPETDSVCPGVSVTKVPIALGGTGNYTYQWSNGTTTLSNTYTSPLQGGSDSLLLTLSDGCSPDLTDTTVVYIYSVDDLDVEVSPREGCEPLEVDLRVLNDGFNQSRWDLGDGRVVLDENEVNHVYPIAGDYTIGLSGFTAEGCPVAANFGEVNVYPIPTGEIFQSPDQLTVISNLGVFRIQSSNQIDSVYWNLFQLDSLIHQEQSNPFSYAFSADTSDYSLSAVIVTDKGCRNTIDYRTRVFSEQILYAPTAFTPNADGINDVFEIKTIGVREDGFMMEIFNRWGERVYSSTSLDFKWDGMYKMEAIKSDMYTWRATFITVNGQEGVETGRIYLIE